MTVRRRGAAVVGWLGIELDEVSPAEKLISAVAGFLGILVLFVVCQRAVGPATPVIVASMGASAVLVFAVPHAPLSQPWPVLGGHLVPAAIGVTCAMTLGHGAVAAATAVGVAILAMHQFKFIHPPGGATALTAVIGGEAVTSLGYRFVLVPVALNALLLVGLAAAINSLFPWRRYPARRSTNAGRSAPAPGIPPTTDPGDERTHEAVLSALREIDSFVDITEEDLLRLHRIITRHELLDPPDGSAAPGGAGSGETEPGRS